MYTYRGGMSGGQNTESYSKRFNSKVRGITSDSKSVKSETPVKRETIDQSCSGGLSKNLLRILISFLE